MAAVVAEDLSKWYGRTRAVDSVSFDVRAGEVLGLLGPNGSGKSTILRMLAGYLKPDAGRALVMGHDVATESLEARATLGYVPEDAPLYPAMRVREFLRFMGSLRGLSGAALARAVDEIATRLSFEQLLASPIGRLSRGYRQRVAIAQALLGGPKLLLLDEPTNGLDPRQIIELRALIRELSRDMAILLSSHILAEVEKVADRVAILLDGRLLAVHALAGSSTGLEKLFLELTAAESK